MHPLSVPELLTVWERGSAALPFERALTILSAACPESSSDTLARLSIGRRDASLLQLREWAFGRELAIVAVCPRCQQTLELTMPVEELRVSVDGVGDRESCFIFQDNELREYEVRYRLPTTEDVATCVGMEPAAARSKLLGRCVSDARYRGNSVATADLPEYVAQGIVEQMAAVDPQADTRLELTCPECQQRWKEVFDIVSFFWIEIDAWARSTLREVNVLARVYSWRESDILALSPMRRQIYLAMAQA
jgi:hypothetical protein